ncbi:MOSC domain-containing protein [Gilvimarinus sp. SDUM040013]|uniref:MOSC domain-containing protein n=1 Tax=Gilvimarinus gilvus TaxID=3058038 RepID=A0ABU4RU69_9GAMM|nr:MOSC domain-containing protein [Gilvimarinus sp. SDUM040013]MDO3386861.1 MOSC domain-containing protein [Gilvimarinus sp. SDUM040013]MDX6848209.1 MOSC domain-containing protein [Gilvimarinus sp. SDUM040013]
MNSQARLLDKLAKDLQPGRLEWIGLRSVRRGNVHSVESAVALEGLGLEGDHRSSKTPGSGRQVTIISVEFVAMICRHTGRDNIPPQWLRRNLLVSGINLNLLRHQRVQIGEVILEPAALCHPCSRMNEVLGRGGAAAMYGYGGLCAKIAQGGWLSVGDSVVRLPRVDKSPASQQEPLF